MNWKPPTPTDNDELSYDDVYKKAYDRIAFCTKDEKNTPRTAHKVASGLTDHWDKQTRRQAKSNGNKAPSSSQGNVVKSSKPYKVPPSKSYEVDNKIHLEIQRYLSDQLPALRQGNRPDSRDIIRLCIVEHMMNWAITHNSSYVALAVFKILCNYSYEEIVKIHDMVTDDYLDAYEFRRRKKRLTESVLEEFPDLLEEVEVPNEGKRFAKEEGTPQELSSGAESVSELLDRMVSLRPECFKIPQEIDYDTFCQWRVERFASSSQDEIQKGQVHIMSHPACITEVLSAAKLSPWLEKFWLMKIVMRDSGGQPPPNNNLLSSEFSPKESGERRIFGKTSLSQKVSPRRPEGPVNSVKIVYGSKRLELPLNDQRTSVELKLKEGDGLIEVYDPRDNELPLDMHFILWDENLVEDDSYTFITELPGGAELHFNLTYIRDEGDLAGAEVAVVYEPAVQVQPVAVAAVQARGWSLRKVLKAGAWVTGIAAVATVGYKIVKHVTTYIKTRPPRTPIRSQSATSRRPALATALSVVISIIGVGLIYLLYPNQPTNQPRTSTVLTGPSLVNPSPTLFAEAQPVPTPDSKLPDVAESRPVVVGTPSKDDVRQSSRPNTITIFHKSETMAARSVTPTPTPNACVTLQSESSRVSGKQPSAANGNAVTVTHTSSPSETGRGSNFTALPEVESLASRMPEDIVGIYASSEQYEFYSSLRGHRKFFLIDEFQATSWWQFSTPLSIFERGGINYRTYGWSPLDDRLSPIAFGWYDPDAVGGDRWTYPVIAIRPEVEIIHLSTHGSYAPQITSSGPVADPTGATIQRDRLIARDQTSGAQDNSATTSAGASTQAVTGPTANQTNIRPSGSSLTKMSDNSQGLSMRMRVGSRNRRVFYPSFTLPRTREGKIDAINYQLARWQVIGVSLETEINSETAQTGDVFSTRVVIPVYKEGKKLIPYGSIITGQISEVKRVKHSEDRGVLGVKFTSLRLPNGDTREIDGVLTSLSIQSARQSPVLLPESLRKQDVAFVGGDETHTGTTISTLPVHTSNNEKLRLTGTGDASTFPAPSKGEEAIVKPGTEFCLTLRKSISLPALSDN